MAAAGRAKRAALIWAAKSPGRRSGSRGCGLMIARAAAAAAVAAEIDSAASGVCKPRDMGRGMGMTGRDACMGWRPWTTKGPRSKQQAKRSLAWTPDGAPPGWGDANQKRAGKIKRRVLVAVEKLGFGRSGSHPESTRGEIGG
jgi:hypothetical protein